MRVLYLNPFSQEVSGPDESLRTLLGALAPRGLEAHVVIPAPGPQVPRYEAVGAKVHVLPLVPLRRDASIGTALYPIRLLRSAAAVARLARRLGADLIHTNMEVLLEGGLAARLLGLPHVLHYRGNTFDRPKWVFDGLVRAWTAGADLIFSISNATAEVFRRRSRGEKVEVLYNPVDVKAFAGAPRSATVRAELGAGPSQSLIGTVGRLHPRKDVETFLRAAAIVSARREEARFVVVGAAEAPVEEAYRVRLLELVASLGIQDRVVFAGARRDMPAVMSALDLFALTSRHEGFGRVVAEAMAAGRPVVVTDEGALPELVGRGTAGRLAAPASPEDFAVRMLELLADSSEAGALGARAAQVARAFDMRAVADLVWDRYQRLASGHPERQPRRP